MKQLILSFCILLSGSSFSQKTLAVDKIMKDKWSYTPFIFDDGNFIIYEKQGPMYDDYFLNSYDGDGNVLLKRKTDNPGSDFANKAKCWIEVETGASKTKITQSDVSGKVTETELKDKAFRGQRGFTVLNEKGNFEIYLKHIRANYKMEKDMIPYLMVEYDPIAKTCKLNNFLEIPNIKGEVRFIGTKDGETYFVNWEETEKNKYNLRVLSVNAQKQVKTYPGFDFISEKRTIFIGGEMLEHNYPMHEYNSIYFVVNDFGAGEEKNTMNCHYNVCKFDGKEISKVSFSIPVYVGGDMNLVPIPLNVLPEQNENSMFYLRDASGDGLIFATDFSSANVKPELGKIPEAANIIPYQEQFPVLYEEAMKNATGKSVFKICEDGFARLVIVTNDGQCLLFKEKVK